LSHSLTEADLLRYDALLNKHPDALQLDAIDGLLTALVLTPQTKPLPHYFAEILGSSDVDTELAQLMAAHRQEIRRDLDSEHLRDPILLDDEDSGSSLGSWLLGFAHGMELHHDFWNDMLADESLAKLAAPLTVLLGEIPALMGEQSSELSDTDYENCCEELPLVLGEIDTHFKSLAQRAQVESARR
jgi:yecA family protein